MAKKRKKIGLALGGGGARGFCHVGVLKVFEENSIPIDFISGCSMGAIIGGCYAHGVPLSEMEHIAKKFKSNTIIDFDPLFRNQGLFRGNRAASFLKKFVGGAQIEDCKIPFAATAVDIKKAELVVMKSGSLVDAMRASFSIPVAFQCTSACGRDCLVDGGVIERVPINAVREMGADIVIGVDALGAPEEIDEVKNILEMLNRVFLILDWEGWKHKAEAADFIITPHQPEKMIHDFKKNILTIEAGREATEKALPEILELIK